MNRLDEIKEIIENNFKSVYCDTCVSKEEDCDDCHRKSMNWGISSNYATYIAQAILDLEVERLKPMMDSSKELIKYVRTKYNVSDNEKLSCPYMVKLEQAIKTVSEGVE